MKNFIILLILVLSFKAFSQDSENTVTIVVSGQGETQNEAKQNALRNALEQAFGVFISSKTELLNDELIADQITSVSSGNIKSYEILNEIQLPNGNLTLIISSLVSIEKLKNFVKSKGVEIEYNGELFALNVQQQRLNEESEIICIDNLLTLLDTISRKSLNYTVNSMDPRSIDDENKNWEVLVTIQCTTNNNISIYSDLILNTLKSISLNKNEIDTYKSMNKKVYSFKIKILEKDYVFYLRKQKSYEKLILIASQIEKNTRNFIVSDGIKNHEGVGDGSFFHFTGENKTYDLVIPDKGAWLATFYWKNILSLEQLSQLSKITVRPL